MSCLPVTNHSAAMPFGSPRDECEPMAMTNLQRLNRDGDLHPATIRLFGEVIANHLADGHRGIDLGAALLSEYGDVTCLSYACECGEVVGVAVERSQDLEWAA